MTNKRSGSSRFFFYFFFGIFLLFLAYYGIRNVLTKWDLFTIDSIEISGNQNLEIAFLENLSKDFLNTNLFATNKEDVLKKYENIIRIKDIEVSRVLPNKLRIRIIEKIGKFYIKTVECDIFSVDENKEILDNNHYISENLPIINTDISKNDVAYGKIITNKLVDKIFQFEAKLQNISPEFTNNISEYIIQTDEIYLIENHTGHQIVLGNQKLEEKIKYYQIIQQNRTFEANTIIDLRYDKQLVIRSEIQ